MNKKGLICTASIIGASLAAAAFIAVPFMTPSFRVRKAVEKCEINQGGVDCKSAVAGMSKEEILDYIQDDEVYGNEGNY